VQITGQKKKKHIGLIIVIILALCCFIGLTVQVWLDRNSEVFLELGGAEEKEQDVTVWIEVTKSWADFDENKNPCYGAQYDGFVENHMNAALMDWELEILLPVEA